MPPDDKTVTEREAILRERAAFAVACRRLWAKGLGDLPYNWRGIEVEAAAVYPLPKVTRPRVVKDAQGFEWRFVDGKLEWRHHYSEWLESPSWSTAEATKTLADLLANPTETVDA